MLAAVVILRSGGSIHERSYWNESEAIGAIRARTLLSFATALDFDSLRSIVPAGGTWTPVKLAQFFEPGEMEFVFAAPAVKNSMYAAKVRDFTDEVRARVASPEALDLEVVVRWAAPADRRGGPHEYRLIGGMHRPAAGFTLRRP